MSDPKGVFKILRNYTAYKLCLDRMVEPESGGVDLMHVK